MEMHFSNPILVWRAVGVWDLQDWDGKEGIRLPGRRLREQTRITFHEATDYGKVRCKITKG
jgi:hypothetical protein